MVIPIPIRLDLPIKGLTGAHFTNGLWAHNPSLVKMHVAFPWNLMTWPGHNFAHTMTALLSWHVQICDLIESSELTSRQYRSSQDLNYEFMNDLFNAWVFSLHRHMVPAWYMIQRVLFMGRGLRQINLHSVALSWRTLIINLWHIITLRVVQWLCPEGLWLSTYGI